MPKYCLAAGRSDCLAAGRSDVPSAKSRVNITLVSQRNPKHVVRSMVPLIRVTVNGGSLRVKIVQRIGVTATTTPV